MTQGDARRAARVRVFARVRMRAGGSVQGLGDFSLLDLSVVPPLDGGTLGGAALGAGC